MKREILAIAEYYSSVEMFLDIYFETIGLSSCSILVNERYDNDAFNLYLQVEQVLLKCSTKSN